MDSAELVGGDMSEEYKPSKLKNFLSEQIESKDR